MRISCLTYKSYRDYTNSFIIYMFDNSIKSRNEITNHLKGLNIK